MKLLNTGYKTAIHHRHDPNQCTSRAASLMVLYLQLRCYKVLQQCPQAMGKKASSIVEREDCTREASMLVLLIICSSFDGLLWILETWPSSAIAAQGTVRSSGQDLRWHGMRNEREQAGLDHRYRECVEQAIGT